MVEEKKPRKTRKDKGKKRGKRRTKNPQFQRGSIDFRTIGTQQTIGANPTLLAGLVASSRMMPPQINPDVMNELRKKTEELTNIKNELQVIKQSQTAKPDTEQAQEERNNLLHELRKTEARNFLQQKVSGVKLQQEKERGFYAMDRLVETEGQRQRLENIVIQKERELQEEYESNRGLQGQLGREIQQKEEELSQTRAQLQSLQQSKEKDIMEGFRARDEQLQQAEIKNIELKNNMMNLEKELELNKQSLEDYRTQMKSSIPKSEYDSKIGEFNKEIRGQEEKIKFYKEQESKANKTISRQQLKLLETRQNLANKEEEIKKYKQIEQQRDTFEEERQALKAELLEASTQRDLIQQIALEQEEDYNTEIKTTNEVLGMMSEDILSEKHRRYKENYPKIRQEAFQELKNIGKLSKKRQEAFNELKSIGEFSKIISDKPKILLGNEEQLYEKYGFGNQKNYPTDEEIQQLYDELKLAEEEERIAEEEERIAFQELKKFDKPNTAQAQEERPVIQELQGGGGISKDDGLGTPEIIKQFENMTEEEGDTYLSQLSSEIKAKQEAANKKRAETRKRNKEAKTGIIDL